MKRYTGPLTWTDCQVAEDMVMGVGFVLVGVSTVEVVTEASVRDKGSD